FTEAWGELCAMFDALGPLPAAPRRAMLAVAEAFFDFAVADLARYQLMNQRTIPDFRPSGEAYAASIAAYERMRAVLRRAGGRAGADLHVGRAWPGGFPAQQLPNAPGGPGGGRHLPRLVDMY